jgi:hypothetical protein
MARCEDIKLLLGPFEDGELEPHEMQEVARHVVGCGACERELADYRTLGLALRGGSELPDLNEFSAAVLGHIAELPIPIGTRVRRFFNSFAGGIGATVATGLATAAVAVVTALILTPYVRQFTFGTRSAPAPEIAARAPAAISSAAPIALAGAGGGALNSGGVGSAHRSLASSTPVAPDIAADLAGKQNSGADDAAFGGDEERGPSTVISRLEASSPSVAVWSEPQSNTTVIWVPDQQP